MDYQQAGVNIEAGRSFVDQIRALVQKTHRPEVLGGLGGFGGYFELPTGYQEPILVSGTDGVGTKLKIAHTLNHHNTVGIDLVAMCVNDILTSGAEPLFFLDYIATGKLEPDQLTAVVEGISAGCEKSGCALLGGETAEMPGFYQGGEYDLAGFCVGIVEKSQLKDGSQVKLRDRAIGLASQGLHSNGFSLVRKIIADNNINWSSQFPEFEGKTLGEVVLTPTEIYVKPVLEVIRAGYDIHGMAHITGGGLPENLPRCLSENQSISLNPKSWAVPPIFSWLAQQGNLTTKTLYETFNMGIGFVLIVPPDIAEELVSWFNERHLYAYDLGEVVSGSGEVLGLD
ncbi:phosphoribosylformylglycinamidine cyclo-ligase [Euhalothece natronophila Z-M001]|uniref:Phosphoribosylformylglycinamidine cyclo-ligase n=1 Tax=Euhalothece natronophila Z-M001 TaxID=522448 RepID=A0A5B8NKZ0_9CHRO|nr:phosphoribosylformylglycinamidine cyclo-ligase [Euhalothece natronophila]QDZ40003.1 phosphoribosylformylglycinamidine cyclo-ligase [Euhalothece natronophila Z-M001]